MGGWERSRGHVHLYKKKVKMSKKIKNTGPKCQRVSIKEVADALGAKIIDPSKSKLPWIRRIFQRPPKKASEILIDRYIGDDEERQASLEEERAALNPCIALETRIDDLETRLILLERKGNK